MDTWGYMSPQIRTSSLDTTTLINDPSTKTTRSNLYTTRYKLHFVSGRKKLRKVFSCLAELKLSRRPTNYNTNTKITVVCGFGAINDK